MASPKPLRYPLHGYLDHRSGEFRAMDRLRNAIDTIVTASLESDDIQMQQYSSTLFESWKAFLQITRKTQ